MNFAFVYVGDNEYVLFWCMYNVINSANNLFVINTNDNLLENCNSMCHFLVSDSNYKVGFLVV